MSDDDRHSGWPAGGWCWAPAPSSSAAACRRRRRARRLPRLPLRPRVRPRPQRARRADGQQRRPRRVAPHRARVDQPGPRAVPQADHRAPREGRPGTLPARRDGHQSRGPAAGAQPNQTLLKAVLRTKHLMNQEVLKAAQHLVRQVVEELMKKLARTVQQRRSWGPLDRRRRSLLKIAKNFDVEDDDPPQPQALRPRARSGCSSRRRTSSRASAGTSIAGRSSFWSTSRAAWSTA